MADESSVGSLAAQEKRLDDMRQDYQADMLELKQLLQGLSSQLTNLTVDVTAKLSVIQTLEEKHSNSNKAIERAFAEIGKLDTRVSSHGGEFRFYKGATWAIGVLFGVFAMIITWYVSDQHRKVERVYEYVIAAEAAAKAVEQANANKGAMRYDPQ